MENHPPRAVFFPPTTNSPQTPQTLRFWRSYLAGLSALGLAPDPQTWKDFLAAQDALGPFEELLNEGRIHEALCIYRAHEPFSEADPNRVPDILKASWQQILAKNKSPVAVKSLLSWTASLELTDPAAKRTLSILVSNCARQLVKSPNTLNMAFEVAQGAPAECIDRKLKDYIGHLICVMFISCRPSR